jgi:ABC-type Na+ efflux pump permease subunit
MKGAMSRNLYLLAASLLLLSLISCGMSLVPNTLQPGLPVNGSVWKTIGLVFLLASLLTALAAILTAMFEQVERRNQERMRRELKDDLARLGRNKAATKTRK